MSAVSEATTHLHPLISDLGLILMTAGIAVLIFKNQANCWYWGI
jgi:CPA2 family monovalent cation:H+ antiporter-2